MTPRSPHSYLNDFHNYCNSIILDYKVIKILRPPPLSVAVGLLEPGVSYFFWKQWSPKVKVSSNLFCKSVNSLMIENFACPETERSFESRKRNWGGELLGQWGDKEELAPNDGVRPRLALGRWLLSLQTHTPGQGHWSAPLSTLILELSYSKSSDRSLRF